jgi:outer membrane receptor for ferrienterochelin and colicin
MKTKIGLLLLALLMAGNMPLKAQNNQRTDTLMIRVEGLCGMCKTRIEKAALQTKGVTQATWDSESRMLTVITDPGRFRENKLHYQVASAGHDTEQLLAPDPVYESLPGCCKYRDYSTHDEATGSRGDGITGYVSEAGESGETLPLAGANVYWMGTTSGTITGEDGQFFIEMKEGSHMLIISFVGYGSDTLHLEGPSEVEIGFSKATALEEVRVVHKIKATSISFTSAYNIQNISEKELTKAACCNLSESFETNPTVDASLTDAVTGTRKIEMLGLAGPYVQITRENMPDVRGLSSLYGLTYIPGTWIEGIQLNTGAGSVVNGYESITGQINVELRKPENSDRLFVNLYGNIDGAMEANLMSAYKTGGKWSGSTSLHGNYRPFKLDHNMDGFSDHPTGENLVAMQRFKYSGENGFESQLGVRVVYTDLLGGQTGFNPDEAPETQAYWGSGNHTKRVEAWGKVGKIFENRPYSSIGFQLSGVIHRQQSFFGLTDYNADQQSLYSNLIYQSILGSTNHQYRTGISFQADNYEETIRSDMYNRKELVPGAFLEYTFNHLDIFTAVAGIRADYHSNFGTFVTPRLHIRYEPIPRTVFRASAGRGQKTASIFAENIGIFASSRFISIEGDGSSKPYGLDAEVAWSYGLNMAQGFRLGSGEAVFKADFYYTRFSNQIVVDYDRSPQEIHFYNLDGNSYSKSVQVQMDLEPVERYDIRFAYRFNDVQSTYGDDLLPVPLSSRNRAFVNMAYETLRKWTFDITWNWQDSKRIPGTQTNPEAYRVAAQSPAYSLVNMQVGKTLMERLNIYVGIENLFGYTQENPIIASEDPFGPYFDSSLIWGPVFGRKFYAGLRFRIS